MYECIYVYMSVWMYVSMDGYKDICFGVWMNRWVDGCLYVCMDGRIDV